MLLGNYNSYEFMHLGPLSLIDPDEPLSGEEGWSGLKLMLPPPTTITNMGRKGREFAVQGGELKM